MAEESKISDDEILSAFKADQPTVSQPVSSKDETKGISDDEILSAFKGDVLGTRTSGGTLSGGGEMFRPEMVGSVTPPEQSSLIGSGALGSGQFAPIPVGSKGKFDEYAGITDPNTRKGIAETVFKGITNPHDLEELHDKVPWYNIAENPVQMESLFQYKWNKKADPFELAADAAKAGVGMLESLPPLAVGAGRLAKDALAGAVYAGDPSAFGKGRTLTDEEKKGLSEQEIRDAELSLRDKTYRSARVFGDAALEAEEQLRKAVTSFAEGKSMLYDKARVAFANAGDYGDFSGFQATPETIQEAEIKKAAKTAELMGDARKNFATRLNAKHVEHLQKEKNPAVLARELSAVWQYPAVKSFATDIIENLMPPAEDAAPGFGGDIEAAKAARRAHAAEAAEAGVQSAITEANRLREDPEQVGAVAMTTPVNVVGAGGMILGGLGRVNQALVRGLKAFGKTDQEINAMFSAERATVQAQREAAALAREQPGRLESALGSMADTADKIPGALAKIPQPVQYIGSTLLGAGAGAAVSDDPLAGAFKGATTGAGIKLGGKAILAAPRLGQELLKAGRLSGAELGRFEAMEKMGSASPAVQKFVNWSQKAGGGKALDFIEKNANVFVQHNVSMMPMMMALGILEDKDAKEFSQMWAEFATYGFLHGQVLGGMLGNDPVRMKMNRDSEMRQAQRVMQASSSETRDNLRNLNWDRVVEHSEARLERTKAEYAKQLEADPDSPEAAQAKSDYDFAHQIHRQNLIAPPEARAAFEDGIKLSLAKASNLINGVLTPNSNMNVELLTTPQIYKKMIDANPNYNGVGAPLTMEQAMAMNPGADGVKIGKGISKDGFTMDAAKDTVFVNIDNAMSKARLTGEAIPNVLAHEVVGHGLFGKEEYRQKIAPLYNKMFGSEVMDENGNWREVTPAQPGLSREDLFEKFFTKYLAGKTPESVAQYAEAAGVWDKANNTFDKNKVVDLMREEVLAEAHAGRFFSDPESPAQRGIGWLASRISGNNLKSALNHLYSVAGPAVYKQWTSGATGATYSPEVMRAIRNVEREMQKYDGEFVDAEQGEAVAAPITKKDVIKSREMLQKYYGDTGKFETTPIAVVTDKDGKVVRTVDLKDKEAFEGSWNYHQDEATGDNVPNKEKGFGELPPELAGIEVPVGGRVQVQRQIAYDESTGKPLERKNKETVEAIRRRVQMLREAIDNAGDPSELGRFRAVKGGQGKDDEDLHYTGKMTPEQRSAIAALPESVVPASMKDLLFKYDDLMTRGDGTVLDIDYAARLNDKGNYEAFSPRIRQIVPLQLHLSKAGNFYTTAWDLSALRRKVELYKKYSKGVFEPWGGDVDAFWKEFRTKLLPKLAEKPDVEKIRQDISDAFPGIAKDQFDQKVAEEYSKKASKPAWPALDSDPETAKLKRTIYAKMLADPNPNIPGVDLIPGLPKDKFSRSEKKLDKKSDFDQIIKSYRLDAHTAAEENANTEFKYPIPYKARFMPEQAQTTEEQRPAFGGGLLKGLQAISAKYNPKGTGEVRAMVQPAEAQVRFMPSPVEEDYHHAEGSFPKTETSEPYKMSAIHKISDDALLFADKMGGLAVPSIAVVKAGTGIQGFGGITLVGGRDLVDPTNNPVFSGDAYTQRFPKPEYPKVKTKKAQQVIDLFKPAQSQFSHSYGDNVTDIIWDNAVNRPNPEEAVNKLKKSNVAKAAYLGDAAPKPITRTVSQDLGILDTAPMKEWLSKNSLQDINYADVEARKSLGDAIKGGFDEIYPEELKGKANRIGSRFVGEDGQATVGSISRLEADLRNYGKTEIDSAETQKALDAALTGKESDFYQWVENTIEGMYEAPRIRVAGKWEPYNLENIARVMTSGKIAGVEKSMTQSTGLTAAQMAKRFGSLQEMRNTAEAPWGIRPESEVNEARSQVSEVLRQYRDAMTPFYNGSTWDALDTSMSALGAYYRSGRGGETKMKQTLSRLGFTNVPSNVVKQAVEAANAMSAAPVKYFEAKPQRVVQLNEFQGAIVPDNVDPSVLSVLQKNGIETRIIPSDKADDSAYVGSEIDKLKGGKQAQEQAGIRFMPEREEDPTKVAPGFYSKAGRVLLDKMPNRASAEQIRGILDPQKGSGVKPDEMKWSGINQFIDAVQSEKGYVTKDDIKRFLKDSYAAKFETQTMRQKSESEFYTSAEPWGEGVRYNTIKEAEEAAKRLFGLNEEEAAKLVWKTNEANSDPDYFTESADETQYSKYKLPGGTNYEETVLRMPGVDYTSSHFNDVPNYVAHMRTQDFGNGRVIEELQSDLHQAGREKGYKNEQLRDYNRVREIEAKGQAATPEERKEWTALMNAGAMRQDGVADAPFRKDWPLQLFKHALQKAVADGKKWIGWTGGEAQADRYSLSKHVSSIDLINDGDGKYHVTAYQNTDGSNLPVSVINKPGLSAQEVADTIGKPLAEKLIADLNSQSDPVTAYAKADGLDLNVGGEGMKGFYDTMLPKEIGKYVKQWGAKVEQGEPKIWKVAITPEMSKSVAGGQARFMPEKSEDEYLRVPTQEELNVMKERLPKYKSRVEEIEEDPDTHIYIYPEGSDKVASSATVTIDPYDPELLKVVLSANSSGFEKQGYGEALYREIAKYAQGIGATKLYGEPISKSATLRREKLFNTETGRSDPQGGYRWASSKIPADIRFMPERADAEHAAAHEAKDEQKARALVDEAAKKAGYNYKVHRGVENDYLKGDGYVFGKADQTYFTSDKDKAKSYAYGWSSSEGNPAVYDVYLKMENPWIPDKITKVQGWEYDVPKLKAEGYDGVIGSYGGIEGAKNGQVDIAVAFDPNQIKSADPFTYDNAGKLIPLSERFNTGTGDIRFMPEREEEKPPEGALSGVPKPFEGAQMRFNPDRKEETKKRMPMSAVEVLHKNSTVLPKPEKKRSNAEIAIQLADVAERYHGRKVTSSNITPEIENELIINGADEAEAALKASGKNAANWYSTAIQAALKVAGILHKVLTDITAAKSNPFFAKESAPLEAANFALRLPLAITSQNMTVPLNARFAEEQFNIFQQTGKFDSSKKYGGKAKSISANLNLANEMIDKLGGILELQKFVKQQFTVRDLENALSKVTGKKVGIAGRKDDIVNGAAIFGPKIGQGFLQNLMGKFDPVTIDLWMRRTWGRWTGDVVGDGVTGVRLGRMIQAFRDAGKQLPDSIKRLKTVTRSTGLTDTGKPKKPELTVTDNVENQIESDLEFRKDLERIAKETDSEFQKHYALMSAPMSASLAKEVRSAMPVNPASPTQAELESLDKAYRKVVKVQSGIDKLLDEKFSKLTIKQKKALNSDDPKTAIKKDVWVGIQHAKAERTEKLENPEKNLLKPEWSKAAKVIVSELNPVDIPSDQDRMVISRVVNNIRQELERRGYIVTNADVQAILWYPEKDLWAKLAGKKESNLKQSYDDEFIKIAEQRGVGEQARAVARDVRGY